MTLYFTGTIHETKNCTGIWLNTISVKLSDGSIVTIDRDETEFTIEDNKFQMQWNNVYIWNGETEDHNIDVDMFEGAAIVNYEIEDDADDEYELVINDMSTNFISI